MVSCTVGQAAAKIEGREYSRHVLAKLYCMIMQNSRRNRIKTVFKCPQNFVENKFGRREIEKVYSLLVHACRVYYMQRPINVCRKPEITFLSH